MNPLARLLWPIILVLLLFSSPFANAQEDNNRKHKLYLGYAMLPIEVSGVSDIDVSDWQNFGLWVNNGGLEGRARLPLSSGEASGIHPGFMIGYEYAPSKWPVSLLAEFQYATASDSSAYGFFFGPKWKFFKQDRLTIGFAPKLGYVKTSIDLGEVKMIEHYGGTGNYVAPVILPEGTFNVDDAISAELSGFGLQMALTSSYQLTDRFSIGAQMGYTHSFLEDMEIIAGEVTLERNSPALVKPNGGNAPAGIDPEADVSGLFFLIGLEWAF